MRGGLIEPLEEVRSSHRERIVAMLRGEAAAAPLAEVRVLFIATSILRCARNLRSGVFIGTINRTNRPILWTNRPEPIPATIAAQDFDEMPGAVRCRGVIHTHTPTRHAACRELTPAKPYSFGVHALAAASGAAGVTVAVPATET